MISLLISFSTIFLLEIADKTMLLTLSLSTKIKKSELISGILFASFIIMLIPVLIGNWLSTLLPRATLVLASGLIFLIIGIFFLFDTPEQEKEKTFKLPGALIAFIVFTLAEMGDKTQLAAFSIAINLKNTLLVWLGASLGLFIPNLIVALIGSKISKINQKITKYVSSTIFITIGILIILEYFGIITW